MDEADVDTAVIHPPSWDPGADALAEKAVLDYSADLPSWVPFRSMIPLKKIASWRERTGMLGLRYTFLHEPARQWVGDGTLDWLWAAAKKPVCRSRRWRRNRSRRSGGLLSGIRICASPSITLAGAVV